MKTIHTEGPQILGVTVRNLVFQAAWHVGCMYVKVAYFLP